MPAMLQMLVIMHKMVYLLGVMPAMLQVLVMHKMVRLHDVLPAMLRLPAAAHLRLWTVPHDTALCWLALFLGVDLCYYALHRFCHESHFAWWGHSVHHSGEVYNVATALRQGVVQGLCSPLFYVPLAVLGLPPAMFLTHKAFNLLYQFYIHTECLGSLGPLEYVLNTPSHHRVHHRPGGECNYAGVLIIWDRLFGTFVPENERRDWCAARGPSCLAPAACVRPCVFPLQASGTRTVLRLKHFLKLPKTPETHFKTP